MTIGRVKVAGWAVNEELTSGQITDLDINAAKAIDRTSAGDTVSGPLTLSGAGRIVTNVVTGADADTTYHPNAQRVIRITSAVTAARTFTCGTTGVVAGDILEFFADTTATQVVSISDGSNVIWRVAKTGNLSTGCSSYLAVIYVGSAWRVFRTDRAPGLRYEQFQSTTPTTWTCPPGVYSVQVTLFGGGGGGAGGMNGDLNNTTYPKGGGGGGCAIPNTLMLAVTPGTSYNVAAGAGGTGGTAGNAGADGSPSYFDTFYGRGGGGGGLSAATTSTAIASGGTPSATGGAPATTTAYHPIGLGHGGYSVSNAANSSLKVGASGFQSAAASAGSNGTDNGGGGGHKGGGGGASGAAGPRGAGGAGGNGGDGDVTLGTNGTNGSNAGVNSGAGGGGGGGGGCSATTAGTAGSGGNGGSGIVIVVWG